MPSKPDSSRGLGQSNRPQCHAIRTRYHADLPSWSCTTLDLWGTQRWVGVMFSCFLILLNLLQLISNLGKFEARWTHHHLKLRLDDFILIAPYWSDLWVIIATLTTCTLGYACRQNFWHTQNKLSTYSNVLSIVRNKSICAGRKLSPGWVLAYPLSRHCFFRHIFSIIELPTIIIVERSSNDNIVSSPYHVHFLRCCWFADYRGIHRDWVCCICCSSASPERGEEEL